jgi:hypothetical protein
MAGGPTPTEEYDGTITVRVLHDRADDERFRCSSYHDAIETVRRENDGAVATKIEDRDGEIVFTSDEMRL